MKPIASENGDMLRCAHAQVWPPPQLHLIPKAFDLDVEFLRNRVPNEVYLRVKTWEGVCGLREMDPVKCATCPHVLHGDAVARLPQSGHLPPTTTATRVVRARKGAKHG